MICDGRTPLGRLWPRADGWYLYGRPVRVGDSLEYLLDDGRPVRARQTWIAGRVAGGDGYGPRLTTAFGEVTLRGDAIFRWPVAPGAAGTAPLGRAELAGFTDDVMAAVAREREAERARVLAELGARAPLDALHAAGAALAGPGQLVHDLRELYAALAQRLAPRDGDNRLRLVTTPGRPLAAAPPESPDPDPSASPLRVAL